MANAGKWGGRGVFFNLNTERYQILSGKVGHMVKPPSEHFQFSQKWRKSYFHQIQPTDIQLSSGCRQSAASPRVAPCVHRLYSTRGLAMPAHQ